MMVILALVCLGLFKNKGKCLYFHCQSHEITTNMFIQKEYTEAVLQTYDGIVDVVRKTQVLKA